MTYHQYLDGHILLSEQLANELFIIMPMLVQSILIPALCMLVYVWLWQKLDI